MNRERTFSVMEKLIAVLPLLFLTACSAQTLYVPDPEPDSLFVITAYDLVGKPLAAFRRRRRKKQQ